MYRIEISPAAEKQIRALPKRGQTKIIKRLYKLSNNPLPSGVKKQRRQEKNKPLII